MEPTTLVGAVRSLNSLNDGRATAAQQRLKSRRAAILDRSDSSVEFIAEGKGDPERERREKPVVRSTPPVVDSIVTPAGHCKSWRLFVKLSSLFGKSMSQFVGFSSQLTDLWMY